MQLAPSPSSQKLGKPARAEVAGFASEPEERTLQQETFANQSLEVVRRNPDCTLDQLIQCLRELCWSDVLFEVHKLSRSGQLRLTESSLGLTTTLRVP